MRTELRNIGNSKGAILPASVLKSLSLDAGDSLDIEICNGEIILKKSVSAIPEDGFTGPFTGPFASLAPCENLESAEEYIAEMKAGRKNKDTLVW